jgi:hypothetical protein
MYEMTCQKSTQVLADLHVPRPDCMRACLLCGSFPQGRKSLTLFAFFCIFSTGLISGFEAAPFQYRSIHNLVSRVQDQAKKQQPGPDDYSKE